MNPFLQERTMRWKMTIPCHAFIYVTDFVKQDRTPMPALLTRLNLLAK